MVVGDTSIGGLNVRFEKTLWTLVSRAQGAEQRTRALDQLLRIYWKPAYFFIRRRGHAVEDAKDLTQEFFATFLEKDFIRSFSRERGRFRTFLLAVLSNFLSKQRRRNLAIKRGGDLKMLPLDFEAAEVQFTKATNDAPELTFDREWALALIQEALSRLRQEAIHQGRDQAFALLEPFLTQDDVPYTELARKSGSTTRRLSRDMYVLRSRLKAVLRALISDTVVSAEDLREEIASFARSFRTKPRQRVT